MPRVLFVNRLNEADKPYVRRNIINSLKQKFDMDADTCSDLDHHVAEVIDSSLGASNCFDALIIPVPYDFDLIRAGSRMNSRYLFYSTVYGASLRILEEIKKKHAQLRIVAYTGTDNVPEVISLFKTHGPIDEIVFKSREWEQDLRSLEEALNVLLQIKI